MAAAFPITSEVAANISSVAGDVAYRVVNFQTVPPRYRINLFVLIGVNTLAMGFAAAAVFVRLKDPERRFLIKKTERAEGVYMVPHSPFIASIFISAWSVLVIITCSFAYMFWRYHRLVQATQTLSSMITVPLWSWVWISLFAPIYACHMFPPDAVEEATSKRIAHWVRWRPKTVNSLCYGAPAVVGLPIIGFSAARAAMIANARINDNASYLHSAGIVYQTLYSVWVVVFMFTCALFIVYSAVLIRILKMQLSTLKKLDKATKLAQSKEAELLAQQQREVQSNYPTISFDQPTNAGLHQVSTGRHLDTDFEPTATETQTGTQTKSNRPGYFRRTSWLKKPWAINSSNGKSSLQRELGKYSKLELLKLNTQIIVYEAVVFSVFCLSWAGFAIARASQGPDVVVRLQYLATVFLTQVYFGSVFALASAFLIFWRGLNVANTRMESSPSLKPQGNNMFKDFANKFHAPAALKPIVDDVGPPAISPVNQQTLTHIHVQIELMQHESKLEDSDLESSTHNSPKSMNFGDTPASAVSEASPSHASSHSQNRNGSGNLKPVWQAPDEWERAELAAPVESARRGSTLTQAAPKQ